MKTKIKIKIKQDLFVTFQGQNYLCCFIAEGYVVGYISVQ